ncbi:MAG: Asp-tRNA(Asn)/Glu-tRNA(Gln) amidotransferase subunit GatC [Bacteroidales bacterium]|nr:Asp-tRNA(Asn)/Glu-tRNA(Gln) amidotransferase subunit GatC [Bacteroidales bacterium]
MSLSPEQVRKVAALARLELSPDQLTVMAGQLNRILDFVDQLQQVDTTGVEPMAHPIPVENVFREDAPRESLPTGEALANAPNRGGNFFAVPAVFSDE